MFLKRTIPITLNQSKLPRVSADDSALKNALCCTIKGPQRLNRSGGYNVKKY